MTDNIEIKKQNIINAYRNGNDEQKAFLVNLFGNDIAEEAKPKNIMERVRTFEDACRTLGEEHPMVLAYQNTKIHITDYFGTDDVIAYLKLRIICAALNEGWEPKFTTDEYRWFTWFELFTQQELDDMSEEQRSRVVARSSSSARMRAAALRMCVRISLRRMRTRTAVLGLPSNLRNWRSIAANSLLTFGLTLFSKSENSQLQ